MGPACLPSGRDAAVIQHLLPAHPREGMRRASSISCLLASSISCLLALGKGCCEHPASPSGPASLLQCFPCTGERWEPAPCRLFLPFPALCFFLGSSRLQTSPAAAGWGPPDRAAQSISLGKFAITPLPIFASPIIIIIIIVIIIVVDDVVIYTFCG